MEPNTASCAYAVQRTSLIELKKEASGSGLMNTDVRTRFRRVRAKGRAHGLWLLLVMFRGLVCSGRVGRLLSKGLLITSSCLVWSGSEQWEGRGTWTSFRSSSTSTTHKHYTPIIWFGSHTTGHSPGSESWHFSRLLLALAPLPRSRPLYGLWYEPIIWWRWIVSTAADRRRLFR